MECFFLRVYLYGFSYTSESNSVTFCSDVWDLKTELEFVKGSKSDNAFAHFAPIFTFSPLKCIFNVNIHSLHYRRPLTDCGG